MIPLYKPFIPPQEQLFSLWKEVLDSGYIAQGTYVDEFEHEFGDFIDYHSVVAVNSCTNALQLALHLSNVGPDSEVISTPVTAEPTNIAIYHTGAKIVWADVNPTTGNIDWYDAVTKITNRTKAVMFVDYMGMPAHDYKMYNVPPCVFLIEDAAHALGASWDNQMVGGLSDLTAFSFQAIKHLPTGDGGMLAVSGDIERARRLRWFGFDRDADRMTDDITEAGWKMNMNNLTAAMGLVSLEHMDVVLSQYRNNAEYYCQHITIDPTIPDRIPMDGVSSWWTFTLLVDDRDALKKKLNDAGIGCSYGHRRNDEHPIFADSRTKLNGVDYYTKHCIHIPCGWWVTKEDRERIVEVING